VPPNGSSVPDLGDKYEFIEALGAGAMGCVYKARHRLLGRLVAVKVISAEHLPSTEAMQRALREARIGAALKHPNIVATFDVEHIVRGDAFSLCTVTEFVTGPTLRAWMDERGTPPMTESLRVARELCAGLAHAHTRGVVHRDVKPANVLMTEDGTVKVADFGLARALARGDTVTCEGAVVGTPLFMAPEQIKAVSSHELTAAVDVYAVGVILYRLLTGVSPFQADNPVQFIEKTLNEVAPRPSLHNPSVSPALDRVVRTALAKNPDERYPTAVELLAALEAVGDVVERGAVPPQPPTALLSGGSVATLPRTTTVSRAAPCVAPTVPRRRWGWPGAVVVLVLCRAVATWRGRTAVVGAVEDDPTAVAMVLLDAPEVPSVADCARLGRLVGTERYLRHLGVREVDDPAPLGCYFLARYADEKRRPERAFECATALLDRWGGKAPALHDGTVLEDVVRRSLAWRTWPQLPERMQSWLTNGAVAVTPSAVAAMAETVARETLALCKAEKLARADADRKLRDDGLKVLVPAARLIVSRGWDAWPPSERPSVVDVFCRLLLLQGNDDATMLLHEQLRVLTDQAVLVGLPRSRLLQYRAQDLIYVVGLKAERSYVQRLRREAVELMERAIADEPPTAVERRVRLVTLQAAMSCRSPDLHGVSEQNEVRTALGLLEGLPTTGVSASTAAYVTAVRAYVLACSRDGAAAEAELARTSRDRLDDDDRWWYHRAAAEIVEAGRGSKRRQNEHVEAALDAVPAEFYQYVAAMHFLMATQLPKLQ